MNTAIITTIPFARHFKMASWTAENGWRFIIQAGCLRISDAVCWGGMLLEVVTLSRPEIGKNHRINGDVVLGRVWPPEEVL
jgi:hypothetical protein